MNRDSVLFKLGQELGHVASAVQVALADGKVALTEGIDVGKDLFALSFDTFKNHDALGQTFSDGLDDVEMADLRGGFDEGYEIPSDSTETMVEETFSAAVGILNGIAGLFIKKPVEEAPQA